MAEAAQGSTGRPALPPEILRFLEGPALHTMTIRGPPGAGKTTFALEILRQFEGYRAYVSTRVPSAAVQADHPWVGRSLPSKIDVIELLRFRTGTDPHTLRVGELRDALQARASDLVDLASVLNLPEELAVALQKHKGAPITVVIDSWEAWIENLLGPTPMALDVPTTRWELERSLLDRFQDAGAHVVLVVERPDPARLDYVTDGSVVLTGSEAGGRAVRWLTIEKLRGVRLGSVSYPFTLEGGRFQCLQPAGFQRATGPIPVEPDPGPDLPGLWPGATALAVRFGRLPVPGSTLLEADGETPARLLWRMVLPIVASALRSGGRAVVRPPTFIPAREIWRSLAGEASTPELASSLRIVSSEFHPPSADFPEEVFLEAAGDGLSAARRIADQVVSQGFLKAPERPTARSLVLLFLETPLDAAPGGFAGDPFITLASLARRSASPTGILFVARSAEALTEPIRSRSSLHLQARADQGHVFLTGIRPWTPHFALAQPSPADEARLPYQLVPLV